MNDRPVRPAHRLFVALELPVAIKSALGERQRELKAECPGAAIRWSRADSFHLTLRFLGDVPVDRLAPLTESLQAALKDFPPIPLIFAGLGCFPDVRRPRVLWAGVEGEGLMKLQSAVSAACDPFAARSDADAGGRPFAGHVTLARFGRLRGRDEEAITRAVIRRGQHPFGAWIAREVILIRSELRPDGARHEAVARIQFGALAGEMR